MVKSRAKSSRPSPVTHISKARRLKVKREPQAEPPECVKELWATGVPDRDRAVIVESSIRSDMNIGDP
ncbi:hypothetical protein GF318_02250, partial [Candidatus Micrarchaeota archaeon]|nr:hypothetical protein [Candidatus Micrarchaeota archaeon]